MMKLVQQHTRGDDDLRRVWTFVRSEFWFIEPVFGLKRALAALRLLGRRWHADLPQAEESAVRWLVDEGIAATMLSLARISGSAYRESPEAFLPHMQERLSEGGLPFDTLRQLSKQVDTYMLSVLRAKGLDPAQNVDVMGALEPRLPGYAEPLIEVIERLGAAPAATSGLPRLVDCRIAARRGSPCPIPDERIVVDLPRSQRLLGTVAAFLSGQIGLARPLLSTLTGEGGDTNQASSPTPQPEPSATLFENPIPLAQRSDRTGNKHR